IRYPKGGECEYSREAFLDEDGYRVGIFGDNEDERICLITYGRLTQQVYEAAEQLSDRYMVAVVVLTRLKPLNVEGILKVCGGAQYVYFLEEGVKVGGVGERLLAELAQMDSELPLFEINALTDFPVQGTLSELYDAYDMSAEKIEEHVRSVLGDD
ncbi:MAG: hypothetical protein IJY04_02910, partial [Clostridia bacterium]|nr:hypothetical protein [Clostridia bacterium]